MKRQEVIELLVQKLDEYVDIRRTLEQEDDKALYSVKMVAINEADLRIRRVADAIIRSTTICVTAHKTNDEVIEFLIGRL